MHLSSNCSNCSIVRSFEIPCVRSSVFNVSVIRTSRTTSATALSPAQDFTKESPQDYMKSPQEYFQNRSLLILRVTASPGPFKRLTAINVMIQIHFQNSDVKNSCLDITLLSTAIVKIRERFSAEIHRNRRCRYLIMIMLMTTITSKAEGPTGYIISEVFGTKAVLTQRIE